MSLYLIRFDFILWPVKAEKQEAKLNHFKLHQTKQIMSSRQATSFGVSFFINTYKEKDGKLPIYARITVDGKRVDLLIKRDVEKSN